jgi:hypothetical protein
MEEANKAGMEEARERKLYDTWRNLRVKLGYDYFNPLKLTRTTRDEKAGEKDEWGNPIGRYTKLTNNFYPKRDKDGYIINEAKFRKEQQERTDAYNASPKGQKEQQEIAEYKEGLKKIQAEVDAMEAQYPFLLGRSGISGFVGYGIVDNTKLYQQVKDAADIIYDKPSAYKSGFIVKKYKEMGGTYSGEKDNKGIGRWFKEDWKDIGNKEYPVYRPTKRISFETPLTPDEIKPSNLKKQIALKQVIKGDANLPPFQEKTGGKVVSLGQAANNISESDEVYKFSNPKKVQELANKYLGKDGTIYRSISKVKKYMVYNPNTKKWVHFGQMGYEDFTKHKDPKRQKNYLTRTANIKGDWKDDKYSPNNLSRNLLW